MASNPEFQRPLAQNRFDFNIAGTLGIPLVVEACTNLAAQSWVSLQGFTLTTGSVYFSDPQWMTFPAAFTAFAPHEVRSVS